MTASEAIGSEPAEASQLNELAADQPPRLDEIFGVLQNQRRRLILRFLDEEGPTADIGTLAEHVAAIENDITRAELRSKQRKRVYISLYQSHLPKLDSAEAVVYNQDRGTVEQGPEIEEFLTVLKRQDSVEPDSKFFRAGSSLGGSILLATMLTVGSAPSAVDPLTFRLLAAVSILVVFVLMGIAVFGVPSNSWLFGLVA
ncbi:hypothetical protein HTSR_0910 [Halodesulfurarchaeum formicicum]|uniref:DUF7344 domain-containing protein n=1 Tax=Halodesulfurarchaeum formicicum TaxID=1873524 RepID=A0A1D8S419_9EURY|nr:hypothetical protein [Halodesulfurarchaeum formicicum]AOW80095.1 hypothetical protein HTSR_0910 [Halodesulfurarchaeum formicicum]